jgi:hypothetical protein
MAATLCLIVYALVLANFVVPCLRFDAPSANEAFFCIAQLLPIAAVAIVAPRFRGRLKSAALRFRTRGFPSVLVPLGILAVAIGLPLPVLFVGLDTADLSEEYASIVTDRGRVVAYPTRWLAGEDDIVKFELPSGWGPWLPRLDSSRASKASD